MKIKNTKKSKVNGSQNRSDWNEFYCSNENEIDLIEKLSKKTIMYPVPIMDYKNQPIYLKAEFSLVSKESFTEHIERRLERKQIPFSENKVMIPTPGNRGIKRIDIELKDISLNESNLLRNCECAGDFSRYDANIIIKRHYRDKQKFFGSKSSIKNAIIENANEGFV